ACIQSAGSEESISGTVQGVCSGLCDDTDLTAGVPSKRSIVAIGDNFKFTNGIDREPNTGSVQFRIDVINAVEEKSLEILACAVSNQREVSTLRTRRSLRGGGGTWCKQGEFKIITPVERKSRDLPSLDNRAQRRGLSLDGLCGRDNVDLSRHRTHGESEVQ